MKLKATISYIVSAILCVMYVTAIIGIDVHIDSHNGRTYVVSLLTGTDCKDIHQDDICLCGHSHECDHHQGCDHTQGICCQDKDCTDTVSTIDLTGMDSRILSVTTPAITANSFCSTASYRVFRNNYPKSGIAQSFGFAPPITQLRI